MRRIERLNEQFKREITTILKEEVRDPRIGPLTVTDVEVTADLWFARANPLVPGRTGTIFFFVSQRGVIRGLRMAEADEGSAGGCAAALVVAGKGGGGGRGPGPGPWFLTYGMLFAMLLAMRRSRSTSRQFEA